ncbi:MAG: hypothetical protein IJS84_01370, partial [Spirochaetales bacterium]|nr:hypothetical protein [Spirochaetales bacterium]
MQRVERIGNLDLCYTADTSADVSVDEARRIFDYYKADHVICNSSFEDPVWTLSDERKRVYAERMYCGPVPHPWQYTTPKAAARNALTPAFPGRQIFWFQGQLPLPQVEAYPVWLPGSLRNRFQTSSLFVAEGVLVDVSHIIITCRFS